MKSLDQIIKIDPSIIIMVIVMLMVKIVVIIILPRIYWAPCVKHDVSVFHIVLGKRCVFRLFFSQHFWPQIVWAFLWHRPVLWHQLGILQFSSDTVCLELTSDSPGEGCGPARPSPLQRFSRWRVWSCETVSTSDTSHKSRVSPVFLTSWLSIRSAHDCRLRFS